jgi:hypothetical protein
MNHRRARVEVFASSSGARNVDDEKPSALILTCCEPHGLNMDLVINLVGPTAIMRTEGGLVGLTEEKSESGRWLIQQLELRPDVHLVIVCTHYGCSFISQPTLSADDHQRNALDYLENKLFVEITLLRALLREASLCGVIVSGCIYDPEYDWLSIFDDETQRFLPSNVHSFPLTKP